MEKRQTFQRLKPPCVELIQVIASLPQRPSAKKEIVQSLTQLLKTLQQVTAEPNSLDPKLAEFVFVPISHVLRSSRTVPVHALELCLECISILLRTGWKGDLSPELSGQLLILFTFLANPSSAENGIPATSEELQAAAFKCMAELLAEISHTPRGRAYITATSNIPTLGKAVLVMLDSLTEVTPNGVKLQALAALWALSSGIDDRDALANFLPRMVSSLTKVLTPSSHNRASFRVIKCGLDTLSLLFLRVLSDRETTDLPSRATKDNAQSNDKVLRTASWLHATAAQIKIALANILKLRNHDKKEVRHSLLQLCLRVIQDCRSSLSECIGMVTETMVTLAGRGGEDAIESDLRGMLYSDQKLSDLLRESLHGWVISLPRLMQSKDDVGRRQIIHQVSVTFRLLNGEQTDLTMIDDLLAGNLRDGFSNILNDSKSLGSLVETATDTTIETGLILSETHSTSFPPLKLRLKGQDDMMGEFKLLLQELAQSNSALTVAQDLVNAIDYGSQETQLASFWLSVNLITDMTKYNAAINDFLDFGTSSIQEELLDELYSLSLSKLARTETGSDSHWHLQALSLEVVALQARRYKADFRVELIETLYPVLHLLGSSNPALRNHAMACLNIIAESCGYASASDLIVSNVDYIVNAVGLKLNYQDISPQAPQVLLMMMRLCGPSLLPYLDDLVGSIFSALERYHGYPKLVELLFSVLRGMAEEGVKAPQLQIIAADESTLETPPRKAINMSDVMDAIKLMEAEALRQDKEHQELTEESFPRRPWKDLAGEDPDGHFPSQDDEEQDDAVQPSEPPPPAPRTFDTLLKISELTQHYLTSSSPSLRTSLLSLLHTTIPALARHENSFLPLINTLWPVLLPRIDDPEAYVVSNALDIVALMCTHAGDFMKGRIEGAWEDIKAIHRRTQKKTDNRNERGKLKPTSLKLSHREGGITNVTVGSDLDPYRPELYVDAPTRMIWDSLVRLLSTVAKHVAVGEEYFDDTLDMLDPVLGRSDVRTALESRNADAVWLRLFKKSNRNAIESGIEPAYSAELLHRVGKMPTGKPQWKFVRLEIQ